MPNKYGTGLPGTEGYMSPAQRKRASGNKQTSRVERNNDNRMGQTSRSDRPVREDDPGWNPGTMGNRQGRVPPVKGGRTVSYPNRGTSATGTSSRTGLQKAAMRRMKGLS